MARIRLLQAACDALNAWESLYKEFARIEEAGGLGNPRGRAIAAEFLYSLEMNRGKVQELVVGPLREGIRLNAS
jgi:hypothetical protein